MTKIADERLAEMLAYLERMPDGGNRHWGSEYSRAIGRDSLACLTELQQLRAHNSDNAEPVAWRVKDYADGWLLCYSEVQACTQAKNGNLIQPLYLASPPAKEVTRQMIVAAMQEFNELTDRYISDDAMRRILIKALTNRTPDDEVGNG